MRHDQAGNTVSLDAAVALASLGDHFTFKLVHDYGEQEPKRWQVVKVLVLPSAFKPGQFDTETEAEEAGTGEDTGEDSDSDGHSPTHSDQNDE